jgi:hypothetical protein
MKHYSGSNFPIKPIVRRESAAEIFKDEPCKTEKIAVAAEPSITVSDAKSTDEENPAAYEILLEEIVRQQDEIKQLRSLIEIKIPSIIQAEIQGVTRLLTLNERLNGIDPDEAAKFFQVLDILYPKKRA